MKTRMLILLAFTVLAMSACVFEPYGDGGRGGNYGGDYDRGDRGDHGDHGDRGDHGDHDYGRRVWRN
ncbi:hypothetical protein CWS72_15630 [Telmatospirillum siberiense]|uniref:Lipoprotein n=1 Tax=Telmatospirillum siberiense TaxID=382514 RepID=A0A2N3PTG4_9PROT|nr:hypothetical protein CWS72_15630 [Telmatospirillum siberiense]